MSDQHHEILSAFSRITSAADLLDHMVGDWWGSPMLRDQIIITVEAIRCFAEQGIAVTEQAR